MSVSPSRPLLRQHRDIAADDGDAESGKRDVTATERGRDDPRRRGLVETVKDNLRPHSARYVGYLIRALPGCAVNDDGRALAARPAHPHQRQLPRCSTIIL